MAAAIPPIIGPNNIEVKATAIKPKPIRIMAVSMAKNELK